MPYRPDYEEGITFLFFGFELLRLTVVCGTRMLGKLKKPGLLTRALGAEFGFEPGHAAHFVISIADL